MDLKAKLSLARWGTYFLPGLGPFFSGQYLLSILAGILTILFFATVALVSSSLALLTLGSFRNLLFFAAVFPFTLIAYEPWIRYLQRRIRRNHDTKVSDQTPVMKSLAIAVTALSFIAVIAGALCFYRGLKSEFKTFYASDKDMLPAIAPNDKFVVKYYHDDIYQPGDIILFYHPEKPKLLLMKRLVAVPGDQITFNDGVFSNPQKYEHKYVAAEESKAYESFESLIVKDDCYLVLGDNLPESKEDSLKFGCVKRNAFFGKALYIYSSSEFSRIGQKL